MTTHEQLSMHPTLLQVLLAHLQSVYPLEGCGLLAGQGRRITHLYAVTNRLASPTAFEMEPVEQLQAMLHIEAAGQTLLAIYHSHPTGPERPSATDIARAAYPDTLQLIVSLRQRARPVVAGFMIQNGAVWPAKLRITPENV